MAFALTGTRPADVARAGVDDETACDEEEEAAEDAIATERTLAPTVGPAGRQIFRRADAGKVISALTK
jgi:hypothetical protein